MNHMTTLEKWSCDRCNAHGADEVPPLVNHDGFELCGRCLDAALEEEAAEARMESDL